MHTAGDEFCYAVPIKLPDSEIIVEGEAVGDFFLERLGDALRHGGSDAGALRFGGSVQDAAQAQDFVQDSLRDFAFGQLR